MNQTSSSTRWLILWVLGLMAAGCKPQACGPDVIQEGMVYQAVVLAPYAADGPYPGTDPVGRGDKSCDGFDAITPGTTVSIQMTGRGDKGDACRAAEGTLLQVPSAVTAIKAGAPTGRPAALLGGVSSVRVGGCEGWYRLEYFQVDREADIFSEPTLGQQPPVVMLRAYQDTAGTCPSCEDFYVVRLEQPAP